MRSGMPRGLFLLALTLIAAPFALGGCMSKAKKDLIAANDLAKNGLSAQHGGDAASALNDFKGAQAQLQQAIKEDPDLLDAHKLLAQVDEVLGDEDGAGQEYDNVSRLDPTDSRALGKARYYRQLKQTENSIDEATGEIKAGKFEDGLNALKDALEEARETRSKGVHDQVLAGLVKATPMIVQDGDDLTAQKKYDDALKAYGSAIRAYVLMAQASGPNTALDPATDKVLHAASESARASGNQDTTLKLLNDLLDDILKFDPDNKTANLEVAQVYLSRKPPDYGDAADSMERGGAPDAEVARLRKKAGHP
jgi:tetratricopeptide (TPR) repeat protein